MTEYMKNSKLLVYLFLFVGIGNFLMMIDTILSKNDEIFMIFSVPTNKVVNIVFYATVASFLIFTGIYQNKKINRKNEN